jgi:hypothetical protein
MNLLLFITAWFLIPICTIVNYRTVKKQNSTTKGYFLSTAKSIDVWAKMEFRTLWRTYVFQEDWQYLEHYDWQCLETLSSVLGKCKVDKKLATKGKGLLSSWFYGENLVWILDKIDKNHCQKSINYNVGNWVDSRNKSEGI